MSLVEIPVEDGEPKLRCRILWAGSAALASLGGLLFALLVIFNSVVDSQISVDHGHQTRLALERIMVALSNAESAQRRFLVWESPPAHAAYADAKNLVLASIATLPALPGSSAEQVARAERLRSLVRQRITEMDDTIRLEQAGREVDVDASLRFGIGGHLMAEAQRLAAEMQAVESVVLGQRAPQIDRLRFWFVTAGIGLALSLTLVLARLFRQVLRAVEQQRLIRKYLASALKERTALLREVKHRVGNSLMISESLIEIQARQTPNSEGAEGLLRARDRVAAIGQVHRRLQETDGISTLDLDGYLRALCEDLGRSIAADSSWIEVQGEPAELPVELAVPLGLMITELITNAYRHGYSESGGGKVAVRFKRHGPGFRLSVQDWGKGLPEGFDPTASRGVGMTVIQALAGQLNGKLSFHSQGGTLACLTFSDVVG